MKTIKNGDLHVKSDVLAFLKKVVDNKFLHKVGIQRIIYCFCSPKLEITRNNSTHYNKHIGISKIKINLHIKSYYLAFLKKVVSIYFLDKVGVESVINNFSAATLKT